jgi:hypothetical protein
LAAEDAVEMGVAVQSRGRRNGVCGSRGRPWVCCQLKRKDLLATGWKAVLSVAEKEKA